MFYGSVTTRKLEFYQAQLLASSYMLKYQTIILFKYQKKYVKSIKSRTIYINRKNQWRIMYWNSITSYSQCNPVIIVEIIVTCYQCQKKNQCSARAQFMKCGSCSQVNKVFDPDPLFYIDVYCQNCSKRIKIPKNGSVYKCPFCFTLNKKMNR
ncbi:unnamed protein product [Paramecium sonneborni]|uniref:Uncharacterized protein n=1 Tax=Paramecium sonneborni TaxID=65129 RepID=A0A8S1P0V7_9CILI|nr:unnamed protein product [Paramecium sonneborni]